MSRHARTPAGFGAVVACVLALASSLAGAQTIADYSRAQRALLESTMSQAAARSAGFGASAPMVAAPTSVAASAPMSRVSPPPASPALQVSGVFSSRDAVIAEVVVNATPYLLGIGQLVPGTAWKVEAIAIDHVVLGRQGGLGAAQADGGRRSFSLPALR